VAQDSEQIKNEQINKAGQPDGSNHRRAQGYDETATRSTETGGPKGLEPTRYGDWERKGRCIDF